jgi:sec-independent protein translocase protein TatB
MFGMSFGELCVLVIVGVVVFGPKDLPRVLRKAGQLAGKIRRIASDVRAESGLDEMLRSEGLNKDIAEIRRLARGDFNSPPVVNSPLVVRSEYVPGAGTASPSPAEPDREYPWQGADSRGAIPDTAYMCEHYAAGLPKSRFAVDPLYVTGDASVEEPARASQERAHGRGDAG